ncbi:hypothetical protein PROFUN_15569 [Planoprotostelium fungivorum]|uniref:Uncharacterized protein n=1 Tax=Planoprotostelium fungivorum TaxID=1890364 RepID=A0A2P6MZ23_9EUKA|nr:hypothetical protein PROFUN_15569 [Planoprotostelium fungivorum]
MLKSALLLLALVALGQTQLIQKSTFSNDQCANGTGYTVYRDGKCMTSGESCSSHRIPSELYRLHLHLLGHKNNITYPYVRTRCYTQIDVYQKTTIKLIWFNLVNSERSYLENTRKLLRYRDRHISRSRSCLAAKCQTRRNDATLYDSCASYSCSGSTVKASTYLGSSCSGSYTSGNSSNVNQCVVTDTGYTKFACVSAFPYTANSASDRLTVNFGSTDCTGDVGYISVSQGENANTSCAASACTKTLDQRSTITLCGNSATLAGYVTRLQSSASSVFVSVGLLFAKIFSTNPMTVLHSGPSGGFEAFCGPRWSNAANDNSNFDTNQNRRSSRRFPPYTESGEKVRTRYFKVNLTIFLEPGWYFHHSSPGTIMFKSALLLLALASVGHAQLILSTGYSNRNCNSTSYMSVYRDGRCMTSSTLIGSYSVMYQCSSSSSFKNVQWLGNSCDGYSTTDTGSLNQCQSNSGGGYSRWSCISAFPYVANSASDYVFVTFGSADCSGEVDHIERAMRPQDISPIRSDFVLESIDTAGTLVNARDPNDNWIALGGSTVS